MNHGLSDAFKSHESHIRWAASFHAITAKTVTEMCASARVAQCHETCYFWHISAAAGCKNYLLEIRALKRTHEHLTPVKKKKS